MSDIQRLITLGNQMVQLSDLVSKLEYELTQAKKELSTLSEETLPQAMTDLGLAEFRLTTGEKIRVKPVLIVTLPKVNVDRAEKWLDDNGHTGLMKHSIEINLPKTTEKFRLADIYSRLDSIGLKYEDKKTIHYQTLNKWARECDEQGEVIPTEIFNVLRGMKSEVTQ